MQILLITKHVVDAVIYATYLALMYCEIAVGLQIVEHSGHKSLPVGAACYLTGVGRQETQFTLLVAHHKGTKHLSAIHLLAPLRTLCYQSTHGIGRLDGYGIGGIVKRTVEHAVG